MKENLNCVNYKDEYAVFTQDMKKDYTILVPDMLPHHFDIITYVVGKGGYKFEVLSNKSRKVIDEGLKHVHNDTCYPALCVIGQYLDALKSGKYDLNKTALMITQTGGGCRASNYLPLIRKAIKVEFPNVPVMSLNFSGLEKGNGLDMTLSLLLKLAYSIFYGDLIMSFYNQRKPYEIVENSADVCRQECLDYVKKLFDGKSYKKYKKVTKYIIEKFKAVEIRDEKKVKVGVVGEIYVKYSPLGNNDLEKFLLQENCEPVMPALMDFVLYCVINTVNDYKLYGFGKGKAFLYKIAYKYLYSIQKNINKIIKKDNVFEELHDFELLRKASNTVSNQGVKMGEGWLIPAEMYALAESGTENIVCAQPFGCLPNHIVGKGAIRAVKDIFNDINIVAIDYDPSATKVNQENRIKLMLATAREKLNK